MLKIIPTKELRLGMFVQQMQGAWFDHPFWRKSFLLEDPEDLSKLLASKIASVQIDTGRSLIKHEGGVAPYVATDHPTLELTKVETPKSGVQRVSAAEEHQTATKL